MKHFIDSWFIPIECGIFAVAGTWAVKSDIKLLKKRWKNAIRKKR